MTKTYFQYYHIRVNDLSEEQLNRFKNNSHLCEWMMIGKVHTGTLGVEHYHVLLKYESSRLKSTIRNKFILNIKKLNVQSYYCEPKYENSSIEQFVAYVKDKGLEEFYGQDNYENDIKPDSAKKEKKIIDKKDWQKQRIENAEKQNWDWFKENDIEYTLKTEYERVRAKYFKVNKFSDENLNLRIKGSTKLLFFWLYGESRKGKDSFIRFFCKMMKLDCYPKSKISPYWNGCKYSPIMQDCVSITEFDGPLKAGQKMEINIELIKEAFDKEVFSARCAYSFMEVIRFKYGFISSQVHPSDALFPPGSLHVSENWQAIDNRFSVIEVTHLPALFNITYNVEKEDWELDEDFCVVPKYIARKYPALIDKDGYSIYGRMWIENLHMNLEDK